MSVLEGRPHARMPACVIVILIYNLYILCLHKLQAHFCRALQTAQTTFWRVYRVGKEECLVVRHALTCAANGEELARLQPQALS